MGDPRIDPSLPGCSRSSDGEAEWCGYQCGSDEDCGADNGYPENDCCRFTNCAQSCWGVCASCSDVECMNDNDCKYLYPGTKECCQFVFLTGGSCELCSQVYQGCERNDDLCEFLYPGTKECCTLNGNNWDCVSCEYGQEARRYMYVHQGYENMDVNMDGNNAIVITQLLLIFVYFIIATICLGIGVFIGVKWKRNDQSNDL
eukprot:183864_1